MSWDAIGAIGEVVGALGVVVTLVYLSRQISESSRQMKANSSVSLNQLINEAFDPIYNNDRTIRIWTQGLATPEKLSAEDQAIFSLFMARLVHVLITCFAHRGFGTIESGAFDRYAGTLNSLLSTPGGRAWLEEMGGSDAVTEDVRAILDTTHSTQRHVVHAGAEKGE